MGRFWKDRRGFVLVLSLLALPIFIGYGLIIIDIGRGNNIHADLSAAADAVALAGAGELDGGVDAITRAKTAMGALTNTVSMIGKSGPDMEIRLVYEDEAGNEFTVVFLEDIPVRDEDPIDFDYATSDPAKAKFVWVKAQSKDLITAFLNPITGRSERVSISAVAVAQAKSATCNIPPLYICNPFEYDSTGTYVGDQLQTSFANGDLHGRVVKLHPKGSSTAAPGNFGFLSIDGSSSADAIRDFFAGATVPKCFASDNVQTKPGAASSISQGVNTRFDMYEGPFSNWNNDTGQFVIAPAENVRKGIKPKVNGANIDDCVRPNPSTASPNGTPGDDHINDLIAGWDANGTDDLVYGLPDNDTMSAPGTLVSGAAIGTGDWPIEEYLIENFDLGVDAAAEADAAAALKASIPNAFSGAPTTLGASHASRYEVYRWELDAGVVDVADRHPGDSATGGDESESGAPLCGLEDKPKAINPIAEPDRRLMVAAIIDCGEQAAEGGGTNTYEVNSYASIFLVRPMTESAPGVDATIDVEIVDITGYGGNGTLDNFIRKEAILVR
ncbi:TadE/TadG family type IV pilus assembly protein [Celeribacter litoreus]|uniref:TadE/TadG family type IV pilus assembly protein n=1 Tax=Celeribacter litoreus TaxID=2876714 RepID=UPI001CCC5F5E|nr:pilus assembly protein TadG-related protein [Celeribacter litoreus]MCA0043917.1 pilus assembly protein TadG-related protein [Celeribacter litoreus]